SGAFADAGARRRRREPRAAAGGAPVLPHDGAVQRPTGLPVPHAHRLALIGDTEGLRDDLRLLQGLARGLKGLPEDFLGLVLDLARLGEALGDLAVAAAEDAAVLGDDERGRPGSALVQGEDGGQRGAPPKRTRAARASATTGCSSRSACSHACKTNW